MKLIHCPCGAPKEVFTSKIPDEKKYTSPNSLFFPNLSLEFCADNLRSFPNVSSP
jgi:hypothetical protein